MQFEVIAAVNQLPPTVRRLTLSFVGIFISGDHFHWIEGTSTDTKIELPIIRQLEYFAFESRDHATFLHDSLQRHATDSLRVRTSRPIPRPAPVTIANLPVKSMSIFFFFLMHEGAIVGK